MTEKPEIRIELEAELKAHAAEKLLTTLKESRGADLILDGSKVTFLSGACLQILLSGTETWRTDDAKLVIDAPSDALLADTAILGATDMMNFRIQETM